MITRTANLAALLAAMLGFSLPAAAQRECLASQALSEAVRKGDMKGARAALAQGALLDGQESDVQCFPHVLPPLCDAIFNVVPDLRAVRLLLDLGASPKANCRMGETPLHEAACSGDPELLALLLARGASLEAVDEHGFTPLAAALGWEKCRHQRENVQFLRRQGATRGDVRDLYLALNATLGVDVALVTGPRVHSLWSVRPEAVLKRPLASLGWGTYLEAATRSWQDALLGGGVLLAPPFWVVPSLGVYSRHGPGTGWTPGVSAGLFFGYHASNQAEPDTYPYQRKPSSNHVRAKEDFGLRLEGRWGSAAADRSIAIALQMDLDYIWLVPLEIMAGVGCCR